MSTMTVRAGCARLPEPERPRARSAAPWLRKIRARISLLRLCGFVFLGVALPCEAGSSGASSDGPTVCGVRDRGTQSPRAHCRFRSRPRSRRSLRLRSMSLASIDPRTACSSCCSILKGSSFACTAKSLIAAAESQLEMNGKMRDVLRGVGVGLERQQKVALARVHANTLVIFDLEPLGAPRGNGHDVRAEKRACAARRLQSRSPCCSRPGSMAWLFSSW